MEIMITSAIVAVVLLTASQVILNFLQQQKSAEIGISIRGTMDDVTHLMISKTACLNTFGNINPNISTPVTIDSIKDEADTDIFKVGKKYISGGVELQKIRAGGTSVNAKTGLPGYTSSGGPPPTSGRMLVTMEWEKTAKNSPAKSLLRYFYVNTKVNASNLITECSFDPLESMNVKHFLIAQHTRPAGVAGDYVGPGVWVTSTINSIQHNTIIDASLAANQIRLPAGTYYWRSTYITKGDNDARAQARLQNVSSSTTLCRSTSLVYPNHEKHTIPMHIECVFNLSADSNISHQVMASGNQVFQVAAGIAEELHTTVYVEKIQ